MEIERRMHGNWAWGSSRILHVGRRTERAIGRSFSGLFSRRVRVTGAQMRPVKGTAARRAALALDWPARRLADGYKEMG
jgi:hypothetical protein